MSMKGMAVLLCSLIVVAAAVALARGEDSRELPVTNRLAKASLLSFSEGKTNETAMIGAAARQPSADDGLESQLSDRLTKAIELSLSDKQQNEVVSGNVAYSGIAVAIFATDNLLQLFNPAAPPK